ncbi:YtfJ family protein [uncultured Spongiibacter sp.]|uniref:YtfJ family protein n=1 Tax=Spongiibacter marinus TaxID=354246 RepID=UPI00258586D3|nr:YtfJ family protein [uncultured Spongiibacter sp.]
MLRLWKSVAVSLALLGSSLGIALEVGGNLPTLDVPSRGELVMLGDKVSFSPWSSTSISTGSPALIFHMPARMSSDAAIAPLRARLEAGEYPTESFQSISVVNLDDALWGTSGLVAGELAKNKRAHPQAVLVADDAGRGLKAWQLKSRTIAVILLNAEGEITYLKEGELSQDDIDTIIAKLDAEIASAERVANN